MNHLVSLVVIVGELDQIVFIIVWRISMCINAFLSYIKRQCYQNFVSSHIGLLVWPSTWRSGIRSHLWIHFQSPKTYSTVQGIHWWRLVYFFYIKGTALKNTPLDEKFSGQACEWLHYCRQSVYNSNYILVLMDKDKYFQVAWVIIACHWKDHVLKRKYRQSYTVCFSDAHHQCSAGLHNFVVQATSTGSMKFKTQIEEWISICLIVCIVSTCVFCWTSYALENIHYS